MLDRRVRTPDYASVETIPSATFVWFLHLQDRVSAARSQVVSMAVVQGV